MPESHVTKLMKSVAVIKVAIGVKRAELMSLYHGLTEER